MTLREKQSIFAALLPSLIFKAISSGYEVTLGECYRPPELAELYAKKGKGIKNSLHSVRLAIDINLFKNGRYLRNTEDHRFLGEYWESLTPVDGEYECHWGGRFGDGNHYSIGYGGRK